MNRDSTEIRVQHAHERSLSPGEVLFEEGDPGDLLYVVQSGEIELTRQNGSSARVLARVVAGDFFGEMSVVTGEPRSARAVATAESRLLALDGETLEDMCVERPEIGIRLIRRLSARLLELEQRLAAVGREDALSRVVRALLAEARPEGARGMRVSASLRSLARSAELGLRDAHRALQPLLDRKLVRIADDILFAPDLRSLSACLGDPCGA